MRDMGGLGKSAERTNANVDTSNKSMVVDDGVKAIMDTEPIVCVKEILNDLV